MAWIVYHVLIYPLSLLPLRVIYLFTDIFYVLSISLIPYRKKVITENLKRSFPNKSEVEIKHLRRQFYRHFADLLAEGVKNLSISQKELCKRVRVRNPELMDELYATGKNVLLVSGHYNNWEWVITAQSLLFKHQAVGIGTPLSSKFWDKKLNDRRGRFGMKIIHAALVKDFYKQNFVSPIATLILSDQSPGKSEKAYWMPFLNQTTGVLFGCELLAHQHDQAVVYFIMHKIKRGYYDLELSLICRDPRNTAWGFITEKHTRLLEKAIQNEPANWVWSHKRWKREVPVDIEALRTKQQKSFYEKFHQ